MRRHRKALMWGALGALAILCLAAAGTTVNEAMLQGRAWTFAALQTFGAGATVSAGDLTVSAGDVTASAGSLAAGPGEKVHLEGIAGDTYTVRTAATASLESSIDGARGWSVIGGVLQAPDCAADLSAAPPGLCFDVATGEHVIVGGFRVYP